MIKNEYCIMARLIIKADDKLKISNKKHIIREYANENLLFKNFDLNIYPYTDIVVQSSDGLVSDYRLFLLLMNKNKKIMEVYETKLEVAKYVLDKLLRDDFDFSYENYIDVRNEVFVSDINETVVKADYGQSNYRMPDLGSETWNVSSGNDKSVTDMLKQWSNLLSGDTLSKVTAIPATMFSNPKDIIANNICDGKYSVSFNYDGWTDKNG